MLSSAFTLASLVLGAVGLFAGSPAGEGARPQEATSAQHGSISLVTFSADDRTVSNWRNEAVQDLHPAPLSALAVVLRAERPVITRCVKLNNYWCIKSARWNGEIGADDEGHVGFASADQGADAAVRLLRRYYLDFDRKSALDIVRRWAPAECRVASASSGSPAVLAVRGLGNTLRARWLAARKTKPVRTKVAAAGGAVPVTQKPAAPRVSRVPLPPLPAFRMPSIMAGMSPPKRVISATLPARLPPRRQPTPASVAAAKAAQAKRVAARAAPPAKTSVAAGRVAKTSVNTSVTGSLPAKVALAPPPRPDTSATASPPPAPRPAVACAPDEQRIQNYAARIVRGLDLDPGDDLKLFELDGRPLPNLARVLLAMSSFELGYLHASADLVEAAIERIRPRPASTQDENRPPPTEPAP